MYVDNVTFCFLDFRLRGNDSMLPAFYRVISAKAEIHVVLCQGEFDR